MAVRLGYVVCVVVVACMAMPSVVLADVQDCLPEGESPLVTIGEPAFLCLRFNNNTQALMTPIVDEFTQLSIEDCECAGLGGVVLRRLTLGATANTIMPENTGYYDLSDRVLVSSRDDNTHDYVITVHPVVNDKVASFWKTYKKWAAGVNDVKTVSVITAIVLVDVRRRVLCCAPQQPALTRGVRIYAALQQGKIVDITYDDGCFFCDPENKAKCVLDTFTQDPPSIIQNEDYKGCALDSTECASQNCDLNVSRVRGCCEVVPIPRMTFIVLPQLYLVWSGTDSTGQFMRSAGMRFSRFRSFGVEGLYNSAKGRVEAGAVTAAAAASKVENIGSNAVNNV